jgi:hypothetical protein
MWLVGASILLVRGIGYVHDKHWHAWALGLGLAVGVVKARMILDGVAAKAVARIRRRGRARITGFLSLRSWLLVAFMMACGVALRQAMATPGAFGAGVLGAVYLAVGTALLLADRLFWSAFLRPSAVPRGEGGRQ